jgi:hypothetical protein
MALEIQMLSCDRYTNVTESNLVTVSEPFPFGDYTTGVIDECITVYRQLQTARILKTCVIQCIHLFLCLKYEFNSLKTYLFQKL